MIRTLAVFAIVALVALVACGDKGTPPGEKTSNDASDEVTGLILETMEPLLAGIRTELPGWQKVTDNAKTGTQRTLYRLVLVNIMLLQQRAEASIMSVKMRNLMNRDNAQGREVALAYVQVLMVQATARLNKLKQLINIGRKLPGTTEEEKLALGKLYMIVMRTGLVSLNKPTGRNP